MFYLNQFSKSQNSKNRYSDALLTVVKSIDSTNYKQALKEHKNLLVEFFAPWCSHCKQFNPEYEKAAQLLSQEQPKMVLAQVDCTEKHNIELCKSIPVKGYPTLMLYKDGKGIGFYTMTKNKSIYR